MKKMDSSKQYSDDKNSLKKIKEKKRRKIETERVPSKREYLELDRNPRCRFKPENKKKQRKKL